MDLSNISGIEMDAFQEIGNIGVGNAATSLSKMLNKKIEIQIPESKIVPLSEFSFQLGGPELIVNSVFLEISGDLNGQTMLMFPEDKALQLVSLITGDSNYQLNKLEGEAMSAFTEFANIFVGNFLNGISDLLSLKILPALPKASRDMVQSLVDIILIKLGQNADNAFFIKSTFSVESKEVEGSLAIFFDPDSLSLMLRRLREKYNINI